jgi:hypothetical protein
MNHAVAQSVVLLAVSPRRIKLSPEQSHVGFVMGNVEVE